MKTRLIAITAIALCTSVTGCAIPTAAQRQAGSLRQTAAATKAELQTCEATLRASPEARPLLAHLPPVGQMPSLDLLSDTSTITPEEAAALRVVYPQYERCHERAVAEIACVAPGPAAVMQDVDVKREEETVKLLQGGETWGSYLGGSAHCGRRPATTGTGGYPDKRWARTGA